MVQAWGRLWCPAARILRGSARTLLSRGGGVGLRGRSVAQRQLRPAEITADAQSGAPGPAGRAFPLPPRPHRAGSSPPGGFQPLPRLCELGPVRVSPLGLAGARRGCRRPALTCRRSRPAGSCGNCSPLPRSHTPARPFIFSFLVGVGKKFIKRLTPVYFLFCSCSQFRHHVMVGVSLGLNSLSRKPR